MYFWEPTEAHRVPQRAAHYTGELNPVNTFLEVFFMALKSPPDKGSGRLETSPFSREKGGFRRIST